MVAVNNQSQLTANHVRTELNDFFCQVQSKAFKQAVFAVKDREDALDLVQDAMIRLAEKYSDQPENWPRLFQRILQNAIKDWYRRQKIKSLIFWRPSAEENNGPHTDSMDVSNDTECAVSESLNPEQQWAAGQLNKKILSCLNELPHQQQQAFILRAWWEHDVADTAFAMNCSEGSVKTHYSRACKKMQVFLEDYKHES